jgi:hypothetical protein
MPADKYHDQRGREMQGRSGRDRVSQSREARSEERTGVNVIG